MGVSLLLRESAFAEFKCERPTWVGMNVDSLAKILKMCSPSDSLKLRWQAGADTVNFQCEGGDDDRIADFDLKLMQIESEHMEIPEQQYKVVAKLPSAEFQHICRDLKEFGETMHVKASKEGITFSVRGDVGAGNVMLKPREAEKPEEKVSLTVHEPVTATFRLALLGELLQGRAAVRLRGAGLGTGRPAPGEVQLGERRQRLHAVLLGTQDRRVRDASKAPHAGVGPTWVRSLLQGGVFELVLSA